MSGTGQDGQQNPPEFKRRVRNYLLDKRFQLRWVLKVVVATATIVLVMGYFLYRTVEEATDQILTQSLNDPALTPEAHEAFRKQNQQDKVVTAVTLAAGLFSLIVLMSGLTILTTHKIAGPIYKMRRIFSSVDGDHLQVYGKLRRDDELQEAFVEFDDMLRRVRERRHIDINQLKEIAVLLDKPDQLTDAQKRLADIIERYENSVKME